MGDDPALIWDQRRPPPPRPPRGDGTGDTSVEPTREGRIDLKEASRRFGVSTSTLGAWARREAIDGVMSSGAGGRKWLVTPESVAHHLASRASAAPRPPPGRTAPTADGSAMLVPRDAWDRLMEQLGNLHEAGLHLAEARERAARAETEAEFLRERLGEIRSERDQLKERMERVKEGPSTTSMWDQARRWLRERAR